MEDRTLRLERIVAGKNLTTIITGSRESRMALISAFIDSLSRIMLARPSGGSSADHISSLRVP